MPLDDPFEIGARGSVRDVGSIAIRFGTPEWGASVRALEAVLSRARARDVVWLEANARPTLSSYRFYDSPWNRLEPTGVATLPGAAQRLAIFHANGHVREAAVLALDAGDAAGALPYLLLRANDWVAPVADRARAALERRLQPADAPAWISVLALERHVRALKRRSLAYLFDAARRLAMMPEARTAIREALVSGPTETRRACAELVASLPYGERALLLALAMRDRDPVVASRAALGVLGSPADGASHDIIRALLVHRVAAVRAQALTVLSGHTPDEAHAPLREALFDPAPCVREVAQFELRRCGDEPLPLYVAAIEHAHGLKLPVAIAGLAQCGSERNPAAVAPFLRDSSPRVRFEALRALARLDGDAYAPAFLDALQDASPRVVRAARKSLKRRAHLVDRKRLDDLVTAGGRSAREALPLLAQVDYWAAMLASLRAARAPDLRDAALRTLEHLVRRRTYSFPTDHPELERAFAAVRADLPIAKRIDDLLKVTRPRR
jgi:hypothetical protein